MSYADHFSKHVRIALLRILLSDQGWKSNSSLIHSFIDELGLSASRDQIKTEIAWLAEQGLVTYSDEDGMYVTHLTDRGAEVATGRIAVPGVQRPTRRG